MRPIALTILLISLLNVSSSAQTRPQLGVHIGGYIPDGGNGNILEQNTDPHGEFGFIGGGDLKIPLRKRDWFFHVGLTGNYHQYHFHVDNNNGSESDGFYRVAQVQIPAFLEFKLKRTSSISFQGGISLTSPNFYTKTIGNLNNGQWFYTTRIKQTLPVLPELLLGIQFINEKFRNGSSFHVSISGHITPFNAYSHDVVVSFNPQTYHINQTIKSGKLMLSAYYYFDWRLKPINDSKCPAN